MNSFRKEIIYTSAGQKNWFHDGYYASGSNCRYHSFGIALRLLSQRHPDPVIIETGCQRQEDDLGAGMSSSIFAEYVEKYGGTLHVVDNEPKHLELAKGFLKKWPFANTEFTLSDSVEFLREYDGRCDLLYLDSYDYPVGDMWQAYGGQRDLSTAVKILESKTYDDIMAEFSHVIIPCQQHCLNEFRAIEGSLHKNSIVLIDDSDFPGGGKPGMLKPYLAENGWICLYDSQQTLWVKEL